MILTDEWFSIVIESKADGVAYLNGRINIDSFRTSGKLPYRIEVEYAFEGESVNPNDHDTEMIEQVDERIRQVMEKDKLAILTESSLSMNCRAWVYYTRNTDVFFERFNDALDDLPELPLSIMVDEDQTWEEYRDMLSFRN